MSTEGILLNLDYAGASFTNYCIHRSEAMSRRNTLFRKSLDLLLSEGIEAEEAREIVQQAFEEEENRRRPSSPVSTDQQCRTTRVNSNPYGTSDLPIDICKPVTIVCDSASKFR